MKNIWKKLVLFASLLCLLITSTMTYGSSQSVKAKTSGVEVATPSSPGTTTEKTTTEKSTEQTTEKKTETTTQAVQQGTGSTQEVTSEQETTEADPYKDYTQIHMEADSENRVEQVQGNLPTIWMIFYYNGKNGALQATDPHNVSMQFNGNEWTASELSQWKKTGYGIHYYVLLDTSGSVKGYFAELIDAINGLALKMEEADTLTLYTVGNASDTLTPVIVDATADQTAEIKEKLDALSANDERTYLNDGIVNLVKQIQTKNQSIEGDSFTGRDIIFVLSDGENDSNTGKTSEEVKSALKDANIPVYAFMNKNAQATNGNALEGIAASSSGEGIYVEDNDFSNSVETKINELQDAWIATFTNTDAQEGIGYTIGLKLILEDSQEIWNYAEKSVVFNKAQPDLEPPQVVSVVRSGDNSIDIKFSEFVLRADSVEAYRIVEDGVATDSSSSGRQATRRQCVSVSETGAHTDCTYRLTMNDTIYKGDYCIYFSGITDLQGNALAGDYHVSLTDAPEKQVEKESFFKQFWWIFLVIFLIILAVILLVVFHVIKKNKGIVVVDDKAVFAENTDVKQHIILEQQKSGQPISLYLYSNGKMIKKVDAGVQGSIIIGRSDLCDIFIDDVMMSRQHFAIEYDGESFYIQDLDTTNGTMLNGVKMTHKRRLEKNDRITAGSLDIVVRW